MRLILQLLGPGQSFLQQTGECSAWTNEYTSCTCTHVLPVPWDQLRPGYAVQMPPEQVQIRVVYPGCNILSNPRTIFCNTQRQNANTRSGQVSIHPAHTWGVDILLTPQMTVECTAALDAHSLYHHLDINCKTPACNRIFTPLLKRFSKIKVRFQMPEISNYISPYLLQCQHTIMILPHLGSITFPGYHTK